MCSVLALFDSTLQVVCNILCCDHYHSDGQTEAQTGLETLRSAEVRLPGRGGCWKPSATAKGLTRQTTLVLKPESF